jgi:uncharacterized protein (TIGR02001 family)
MKKWSVLLVAVLMIAATMVPAAQAAIEVEGDVYAGVFDKYMWRGQNLSNSQPVLQGGVDISALGFTLSYWSNVQLSSGKDFSSDEVTETDIVLDYSFDVNDLLSVSVGNIDYTFNAEGNTHELYLGLGLNTLLSPAFTVYYDWDAADSFELPDGTIEDVNGLYFDLSVGHTFELAENLGLNLGALVSYSDESPFVIGAQKPWSDWNNYELSASVDYAVTDQITVSPSFLYSSGISDEAKRVIDTETVGGINVALTF